MYLFVADLPPDMAYDAPRATPEGILDWKRLDWVLHPDNRGVAAHLPHCIGAALEDPAAYDHHFTWEDGKLTGYQMHPLEA